MREALERVSEMIETGEVRPDHPEWRLSWDTWRSSWPDGGRRRGGIVPRLPCIRASEYWAHREQSPVTLLEYLVSTHA